ncbi:hypothetical protein O3597_11580 [Verrucosispora sp. WMMA2044]|uniref:hypothetical protein n=1 Tax=Verrucosispora sp. WMMA2044 TaxID=3016419 RepID=UPI00248C1608|nr:hypothetical protein [Verrucosispora sp. WMMA2044]WBB51061.1 hypothetical protein O3597_11580 [Verrucosispora sp. WMMA2044]
MTTDPRYTPIAMTGTGKLVDEDGDTGTELVSADDAAADAARAGADIDLTPADRDSDPTPVGAADAEADRRRAAGED